MKRILIHDGAGHTLSSIGLALTLVASMSACSNTGSHNAQSTTPTATKSQTTTSTPTSNPPTTDGELPAPAPLALPTASNNFTWPRATIKGQERDESGVAFRTPDGRLLCGMSEAMSNSIYCEVSSAAWPAPNDRDPANAHVKHSNTLSIYPNTDGSGENFELTYLNTPDRENASDPSVIDNQLWWKPGLPTVRVGKASTASVVIPQGVTLTNGAMRCARKDLAVYCQLRPKLPVYRITGSSIEIAKTTSG